MTSTIRCLECGKEIEIEDGMMLCPYCGAPLPKQQQASQLSRPPYNNDNQSQQQEKPVPIWGIVGVVSGIAALLFPYFVSMFFIPVTFICGIVAIYKKQNTLGIISIACAVAALIWIIYTSSKIVSILGQI